jgi:hypothetical protein
MFRGVINGKVGKAAALSKFSDTLTLSQPGGKIIHTHWLCLPKKLSDYAPAHDSLIIKKCVGS